jgi:hypothetical protein
LDWFHRSSATPAIVRLTLIRIGENPAGSSFELNSVVQI